MVNSAETARSRTDVSLSPIPSLCDEPETGPLPSPTDPDSYAWLCVGGNGVSMVSPTLMEGYLAARKAYAEMEETEYGAYVLLTGHEYAHLTRQYLPSNLPPTKKREWQRGFIAGWNACTFGF
jgi:hypothetical protein